MLCARATALSESMRDTVGPLEPRIRIPTDPSRTRSRRGSPSARRPRCRHARRAPTRRCARAPEPDCGLRTPFQRDRDRIVHCKAFRRLKHKTQVFVAPEGDHYRTRLTHTLEVTQVARTVARALALNEDLAEAIGLGHDLGHPPFGHVGEEVLDRCLAERFGGGFRHNEHSLRVVDVLERDGAGLNLTEPVRDGIVNHSWRATEAGDPGGEDRPPRRPRRLHQPRHRRRAARRRDRRGGPARPSAIALLGATGSHRIDTLVHDLVEHSDAAGEIVQGERAGVAMASCASSCSSASTSGPRRGASTRRSSASCGRCSTTTAPTRRRSRPRSRPATSPGG